MATRFLPLTFSGERSARAVKKAPPFPLQLPADGLLFAADEVRVEAGLLNELLMLALLHDAAMVDDQDLIGVAHGFEAMRDHDDGFIPRQRLDGLLQPVLIFWVHIGCGLVQNDDGCVFQHGPGNGYTLLFAAGKACAALADDRVVAVGQGLDEIITASRLCCCDHFIMRCVRLAELDVVFDGVGKEI